MKLLFLITTLCLVPTALLAALRVTVDAGHGGSEKGAFHGGIPEAQVVLNVSRLLHKRLQKDPLFQSTMTRDKNTTLTLEERVQKGQAFNTDIFVSIHANASPNPKAQGAEFYINSQLPIEEENRLLAHMEGHGHNEGGKLRPQGDLESLLFDLKKSHRLLKSFQVSRYMEKNWKLGRRRKIRQGPFYVLSQNESPAILVELGYLTNPSERRKLSTRSYQKQLAKKIHKSLKDYAKNMDKLPSNILKHRNEKK